LRVAVLSDIHGNVRALEAVLRDVRDRGADLTVNLGDSLSGALEPAETADCLLALGVPTVRGNHDRQILECERGECDETDRFAFERTTAAHRAWLRALPGTVELPGDALACHGTPASDRTYLLVEVAGRGVRPAPAAAVEAAVAGVRHGLVLCGHSHLPGRVALPDGRLVVNPGSVGLQAFDAPRANAHAVENGSPHARYAICDLGPDGWSVAFRAVEYDYAAAAATARRNGREDWARWVETGRA
jgi:predicted phosphodiesterase